MSCELESRIIELEEWAKELEDQNKTQAVQINWCAKTIFVLINVLMEGRIK